MTARSVLALTMATLLSACGGQTPAPKTVTAAPIPFPTRPAVIGTGVIGRDARGLIQMFGPAALDVREEGARKLQFIGAACILDAYLYPPSKGKEPVVTYLSARVPDGRNADEASCVTALSQRR
ncbi:MAG: hypothetical protein ABL918_00030 [Chakrabartia sp.]